MFVTCIVTCLTYSNSLLAVTIVNNYVPAKIKRGGHFCVLKGIWVFHPTTYTGQLTLHSHATKLGLRSASSNAIRLVALSGYGSIAHEAKPNGLLTLHSHATKLGLRSASSNAIRLVALSGYGSIAHETKPNGLLTRGT